jgi:hypothetical protein
MMRVSMIAFLTNSFNDSRIKSLHQTKKFLTNFFNEEFIMTRRDKTLINN